MLAGVVGAEGEEAKEWGQEEFRWEGRMDERGKGNGGRRHMRRGIGAARVAKW